MIDVAVIGAGVVGGMVARELSRYDLSVTLIDAASDVALGATRANSAIVHAGFDAKEGSLKALLNVRGSEMMADVCRELGVKYKNNGSLVVGFNDEDKQTLLSLKERARENGVEVEILSKEDTLKIEPNLSDEIVGSLFAPTAGILDPFTMVANTVENFVNNGGILHLNEEVINIKDSENYITVTTNKNVYNAKMVINSAGLYSLNIAKMIDKDLDLKLIPKKGEYYLLARNTEVVNHVCFNTPTKLGKGVLISKTTSNNTLVGPNNVVASSLDDVSTDSISLSGIKNKALSNIKINPLNETIRVFAGNRPHLENYDDFYIKRSKSCENFINLIGIESPGLVSSPAIAEYVVEQFVSKSFNLEKNEDFNPKIKKHIIPSKIFDLKEKEEIIKNNPLYGKVICSCEQVSLGEILDIIHRNVPINSIRAIKKRTRAGFGRCQGGFCQPIIAGILAQETGKDIKEILYDETDSNILKERAK
jgi:glycerol-3-phosphate dehydrogenase